MFTQQVDWAYRYDWLLSEIDQPFTWQLRSAAYGRRLLFATVGTQLKPTY